MGPLKGIKIIEIGGIGPTPFCGMMLADMGADVLRIERPKNAKGKGGIDVGLGQYDILARNRQAITLDLKNDADLKALMALIKNADGLIEGFRPGVMEKLGLGPDLCLQLNPKLVFGRMTGWGQEGGLAQWAGHDINYIAMNGVLDMMGTKNAAPAIPPTLVGDMGGGAMFLAFGMLAGIIHAQKTGQGQVVDAAIIDGSALLSSVVWGIGGKYFWGERGENLLDGGAHFYGNYKCADDKYISVGALEPQFYQMFLEKLGLMNDPDFSQQMNPQNWPKAKAKLGKIFVTETRDHWADIFKDSDACVWPVLTRHEAKDNPQMMERGVFQVVDGVSQPAPAPRFSKTPTKIDHMTPKRDKTVDEIINLWAKGDN